MPCYHPLIMYEHKTNKTTNGKKLIVSQPKDNIRNYNTIELPCGQCIGCRMEYAKQWATRCVLEAKLYNHNYFVTLTYAPEHIPTVPHIDKDTGEYIDMATLKKRDVQLFFKRLRKHFKDKYNHEGIRFYLAGEYGDTTERPHYHAIIFNLPLPDDDLKPYFINQEHQQIYRSKIIEYCWSVPVKDENGKIIKDENGEEIRNPIGISSVGEVTYQSAAYVARYIMKKQKGNINELSRVPEFTLMSRRPGIGTEYFNLHEEEIKYFDELVIPTRAGKAVSVLPPKYFDKLMEQRDPEHLKAIKEKRLERAQNSRNVKNQQTELYEHEQRAVAERNLVAKTTLLKRGMTEI